MAAFLTCYGCVYCVHSHSENLLNLFCTCVEFNQTGLPCQPATYSARVAHSLQGAFVRS